MIIVQNGSDYQYKESLQLLSFGLRLTPDHILDWPTTLCHPIQACKPSDVSNSSNLSPLEPIVFTNIIMRIATLTLVQLLSDHVEDVIVINPRTYMIMMFIEIVLLCPPSWSSRSSWSSSSPPRSALGRLTGVCGQLPPQEASRASPPSAHRLRHSHCHHQDHVHHHHHHHYHQHHQDE